MNELLGSDWVAGPAIGAAFLVAIGLILRASNWSIGAYRDAGEFDAGQLAEMRTDVTALQKTVKAMEAEIHEQRHLKHDWRSFAASFHSEVLLIRQFATAHDCAEIVTLIDRLSEARRTNPLMADLTSMEDP